MNQRIVLITGVSSGIGKETAIYLSQHNYIVYGGARRTERLKELEQFGIHTMALDVTDEHSVKQCVAAIIQKEGRIDVLINNAGYGEYGAIEDVTIENAKTQMEVTVFGLTRMTQAVLPYMREHHFGKILNISSIAGKITMPMGGWYHASKYAVEALSDALRIEVKQFGIDVILIEPGGIKSEWASIAMRTMVDASRNSVYANYAIKAQKLGNTIDTNRCVPKPIRIAKIIHNSIEKRDPKARYSGGFMAKPALFFKWLLCDTFFDKILLWQIR
jgi:NADP-dependent 3-hydroxy acid dehydrogenase YdfG